MPLVGPTLPPGQAQKRKRDDQDDSDETDLRSPRSSKGGSASPASSVKKARTVGPTLPPAPLDERAPQPPNSDKESSSDDDDDFGPNLPTETPQSTKVPSGLSTASTNAPQPPASAKSQRDEWMIVPPSSGDWSSRVDPTKLKNRKFNTAKGAKGQGQTTGKESNTKWTETPDEKRARLQREMMGVKEISAAKDSPEDDAKARENAKKLREYNDKLRGPTLYKEHQKTNPQEKEDDPSARAFDREKDIAGGMKINHTQRREMMKKAADFGSRFSSGKFL